MPASERRLASVSSSCRSSAWQSLADVSGGRFVLGVGAGGTGWDARVLGQDAWWHGFERLSRRFDEALDAAGRDVVTHWPRVDGVYAGDEAVLEQVAEHLAEHLA